MEYTCKKCGLKTDDPDPCFEAGCEMTGSSASPAGSTPLVERLVDAAMSIAMFDSDYTNDEIPEVKSARAEFRDAFKAILGNRR